MSTSPAPAWLGLAGPTASGKTAIALHLAERLPVEIVSVDSALVYRGMDIGTAKPTAAEMAAVPHHLIDILDPADAYSAATFVRDATALIAQIRARGRWPLLVGGTMLYFKALIDGIDPLPAADATVRARLDEDAARLGWPTMHARLAEVDPVTAARLPPNDAQRIQRALEVWMVSGQPISHFHRRTNSERDEAGTASAPPGGSVGHGLLLSLEPRERSWLHQRIAQRYDQMLANGFVDEVQALRQRGDLHLGLPSMRCVGYRQVWEALDAGLAGDALDTVVRERGVAATRQLAKRQLTWLRSLRRTVIDADGANPAGAALDAVLAVRILTGHPGPIGNTGHA